MAISRRLLAISVAIGLVFPLGVMAAGSAQAAPDPIAAAIRAATRQGLALKAVPLSKARDVSTKNMITSIGNGTGGAVLLVPFQPTQLRGLARGGVMAMSTVAAGGSTKLSYGLALPNRAVAKLNHDGSVSFVKGHLVLGGIAKPWAIDARGRSISTGYSVKNNVLTQVVHVGPTTTYPVVADPSVYLRTGWTTASWYFSRAFTHSMAKKLKRYANSSNAAIAGAFALACLPISGPVSVICGVFGAVFGGYAIDQILTASSRNDCIRVRVVNVPPYNNPVGIYVDNSRHCKNN